MNIVDILLLSVCNFRSVATTKKCCYFIKTQSKKDEGETFANNERPPTPLVRDRNELPFLLPSLTLRRETSEPLHRRPDCTTCPIPPGVVRNDVTSAARYRDNGSLSHFHSLLDN